MHDFDAHAYFFDDGVRFECQRCGACCTGAPGVVRVADHEIVDIAACLELPVQEFIDTCLFPWEDGYSIREDDDGRCRFFDDGCRIYAVRPRQCRAFPFWVTIFRSEARWNVIRRQCPGIGKGKRYDKHRILDILERGL